MALKGKIANISPYLLLARDPRDWPKGADTTNVPFSAFRSLEAADLIKVYNTVAPEPVGDKFKVVWEEIRRDRNVLIHSFSRKKFDPEQLIRLILTVAESLLGDVSWPKRLLDLESEGKFSLFGYGSSFDHNTVMDHIDLAIAHLNPAEAKQFFGFEKRRRAYVCPNCWQQAERDWQDGWAKLAQLTGKARGETQLKCVLCEQVVTVERVPCNYTACSGNVIFEEVCLTCMEAQRSPHAFESVVPVGRLQFYFGFTDGSVSSSTERGFADEAGAIEHARLAMMAPYLSDWGQVAITEGHWPNARDVGSWKRLGSGLVWHAQ